MYHFIRHSKRRSAILSRLIIICLCTLGGYGGGKMYILNSTSKEQKIVVDKKREDIQNATAEFLKTYSAKSKSSDDKSVLNKKDATEIAEKTATFVSTNLINNSISGLATKEEVDALEKKVSNTFSSYELSDSQKEDLSKAITAIIESDLDKFTKDSNAKTALSDAAHKNIEALESKAASLQKEIDEINNRISEISSGTNKIQEEINSINNTFPGITSDTSKMQKEIDGINNKFSTITSSNNEIREEINGIKNKLSTITSDTKKAQDTIDKEHTPSDQTLILQSKIDKLTKQYEDILSKYNNQTDKIQSLIGSNINSDNSEELKKEITTLQSALSKLQESAASEISALEERIEELETSPADTLITELKSNIAEQQEQILTYKNNIKNLNRAISSINEQLNAISDDESDTREKLCQQLQDKTDEINQNKSDIETANTDISDMEKELNKLKNGTADSIENLQDQIVTITSSLTEMDSTQKTLDNLLNNLKSTVGESESPESGTILSDLASTQSALSLLEGRVNELEKKTQNITPGVQVPFSFGIKDGEYGYYDANNTFVDFKSQSDINGAVSDATGNMTGTAKKDTYIVTAQGTPKYKTENIKKNFVISLVGSMDPEGNYILKANGQNVHKLPKQTSAVGSKYTGTSGSLAASSVNNTTQLPMTNYTDKEQYSFKLGNAEQVTFPAGYYDMPINVANGLLPKGTFNATARATNIDMGESSYYRYVNTASVPNSNSGTYTFPQGNGETVDLGETNTYRYVNAWNVYSKGSSDGYSSGYSNGSSAGYNSGYTQGRRSMVTASDTWMAVFGNSQAAYSPLIAIGETFTYCHISCSVANNTPLNNRDTLLLYGPNWSFISETPINQGIPDGDGHWRHCAPQGIAFIIIKNNNNGSRDYNFHFTN